MINFHIGKIILNTENNLNKIEESCDKNENIQKPDEICSLLFDHENLSVLIGLLRISEHFQLNSNINEICQKLLCDKETLINALLSLTKSDLIDCLYNENETVQITIKASLEVLEALGIN